MAEKNKQSEPELDSPVDKVQQADLVDEILEDTAGEVPQEESRTRRFFLRLLRWSVGLLVIFGLGIIATILVFYQPKVDELAKTNQELANANDEILSLQNQIEDLEAEISSLSALEERNQVLQDELELADLHIHILSARADVHAAQFALSTDDVARAQLQLNQTPTTLAELRQMLKPGERQVVDSMLQRLELASGGIEDDPFAAQSDLEVLANSLAQLENTYFANP
jgi:peptidoglycan hydrolase CwlO-like protein